MLSNVTCPACQHKYWLAEGDMGTRQICPNCQSPFFAGASVAEARAPAASAATAQASYAKTMIGATAAPIKYNCPRCNAPLEAPVSESGTKKNCPKCTQRLQVPPAPKPEPVVVSAGLNKTMMAGDATAAAPKPPIKYNCPNCKKPLEAPPQQGGTKTNCPYCQQRLQIPAAPPDSSTRNKTMLASESSTAPASASQHVHSADGVRGSSSAAVTRAPAAGPWAELLTPKNVALGIILVLLLLLVVPAVIRGGKVEDTEALARTKMELEKLKMEIELKKLEMDKQAKAEGDYRRNLDEMLRSSRAEEEKRREEDRKRLREIDDEDRRAQLKRRLDQEQQMREKERQETERKSRQDLEDMKRTLNETRRALDASQQRQQTIIQQAPPAVYYPPYHPRYYWPWSW